MIEASNGHPEAQHGAHPLRVGSLCGSLGRGDGLLSRCLGLHEPLVLRRYQGSATPQARTKAPAKSNRDALFRPCVMRSLPHQLRDLGLLVREGLLQAGHLALEEGRLEGGRWALGRVAAAGWGGASAC